jgi:dTDP-4-amino-4,6-dideoxygalactose transaminase
VDEARRPATPETPTARRHQEVHHVKVPLLDLKAQYRTIRDEVLAAIGEVCEAQQFILGPRVEALEREVAAYCGSPFATGVSSGTDALLIALMAAGIGAGDRVLTSAYSFFATAGAICRLGARPVFADIDAATYNLAPEAAEAAIAAMRPEERAGLKALLPVHLFGQCAEMEPLLEIARRHRLVVIEDAAPAIGAQYRGRKAGAMGDFGCFSFFPSKNLGAFGDAGLVTTAAAERQALLQVLRVHGAQPKYHHRLVGGNFRLDALQAAVLSVKLRYLEGWTARRRANAETYRRLFEAAGLADRLRLPSEAEGRRHIYNQFVVALPVERRDPLRAYLQGQGVGSEVYYPIALHLQECFRPLGYAAGAFPAAERAAAATLALPIYPELETTQQEYVVSRIAAFFD